MGGEITVVGAFLSYVGFLDLESIHNGTETLQRYESKDSGKVLLNKYITHTLSSRQCAVPKL